MKKTKETNKMSIWAAVIILTLLLAISMTTLIQWQTITSYAYTTNMYTANTNLSRNKYTLEDVRQLVESQGLLGGQGYFANYGIEDENNVYDSFAATQNTRHFYHLRTLTGIHRTVMRASSKPNRIVVVLMACGFTAGGGAGNIGWWPHPSTHSFLWHARTAMYTMLNTHPFNLFADYFAFYADHTVSNQQGVSDQRAGSQREVDNFFDSNLYTNINNSTSIRIPIAGGDMGNIIYFASRQTNAGQTQPNMLQIIANSTVAAGTAWTNHNRYRLVLGIGLTTVHNIDGGWHRTFLHEFGHTFGSLADVITSGSGRNAPNMSNQSGYFVSWNYWIGHGDNIVNGISTNAATSIQRHRIGAYRGFNIAPSGWSTPVPARNCLMSYRSANTAFCAVSSSELVRRLAYIAGETFFSRHPNPSAPTTGTPVYVEVLPNPHNRILPYAFSGNGTVRTITIPESIRYIGDYAFLGVNLLRTIYNFSRIPQSLRNANGTINERIFTGNQHFPVNRSDIRVYIPPGTRQAYIDAGWGDFELVYHLEITFYTAMGSLENDRILIPRRNITSAQIYHYLPTIQNTPDTVFNFSGWWTSMIGGWQIIPNSNRAIDQDTTLIARWETHVYFDANGGTPSPNRMLIIYGMRFDSIVWRNIQKPGHRFEGWWTDREGYGRLIEPNDIVCMDPPSVLHARWTRIHTVSFDFNGGTGWFNQQIVDDGYFASEPLACCVLKPRHEFRHWALSGDHLKQPFNFADTHITRDIVLVAIWEYLGIAPVDFRGGNNSVSCSWELSEAGHLVFLAQEVNVGNTYLAWSNFVLVNDIYLNDLSDLWMMLMLENWELFVSSWQQAINLVEYYGLNIWTPIGNQDNPFMGLFDGGGFSIRGMVSVGAYSQGLFGHMFGGTIENLRIEDSFVVGGENTGSVVGSMMWGSVINVHSDTVIRVTANNTGGLVGLMYFSSVAGSSNSGNIYANNFINDGSVLAADYIGGIAGFIMHSAISESRNYGYIFSCCSNWNVNFIGGILGAMEFSLVINSANMGMLMVGGEAVGGIVGLIYSHSVVVNNYNLGHIITGSGWVGGIVGMSLFDNVQIINNFNAGVVCYFNAGSIAGFISNWWNGLVVSNNYGNSNLFMMWGFSQNYIFNCNDNLLSALNAFMSTNGWVNNWGWVGHPTMGLHMLAGWEIDASTGLPKHILNNFYFGANINNNLMKLNMPHRLLFKYSDMAILQVRLDVLLLQRQYVMVHIDYIMLYMWYDA